MHRNMDIYKYGYNIRNMEDTRAMRRERGVLSGPLGSTFNCPDTVSMALLPKKSAAHWGGFCPIAGCPANVVTVKHSPAPWPQEEASSAVQRTVHLGKRLREAFCHTKENCALGKKRRRLFINQQSTFG